MDVSSIATPILGGVLAGLGAAGMLMTHGRIAGVSGFLRATMASTRTGTERSGRVAFLMGLLSGGALLSVVAPNVLVNTTRGTLAQAVVAGLLVGFGSQVAAGCTSGHALGLGRLSPRSVAALSMFVLVGALSLLLGRWLAGGAA